MAETPRRTQRHHQQVKLHLGGEAPVWRIGEFRVLRLLGEGAMGKVYEAEQESLGRKVALKVLPDDFAQDADAVERFEREARAMAALRHPHIVPIFAFGDDDGQRYYAMEYVEGGRSLRDLVLDPQAPLRAERQIAKYVLHVALALEYAHQQGVIHRDVKPANVLIRKDDQAAITDFGLARRRQAKAITQAGALMGTPVYMAPEQALGQPIDHRVDVYALGVTLYECLAGGKLPFYSESLRELLVQITQQPPPPLRTHRPDASPDLEAIALKALSKRADDRYATAQEMADDLIRFFRGDVVRARRAGRWEVLARQARKHPLVVALSLLLVLALVGGLGGTRLAARVRAVGAAEARVAEADALVEAGLARWEAAAAALARARAARDGHPHGRGGAAGRAEGARLALAAEQALDALRQAEQALLRRTAAADAPADRALDLLREAWLVAPAGHAARDAARDRLVRLVRVRRARAAREGDLALVAACDRELAASGALDAAAAGRARRLGVTSDPPGARASLREVLVDADGGWSLGPPRAIGETPVVPGVEVEPGEYVVELEGAGRLPTRVPLLVPPPEPLAGVEPAPVSLQVGLPPLAGSPEGFVYVPAGEFLAGGDPQAVRPLRSTRAPVWVDGFFLGAREVTVGEWAAFLRALPPAARQAHLGTSFQMHLGGGGAEVELAGDPAHPVAGVRLESARAYCQHLSARDPERTYRLPTDVEWEKAGRGPAGRAFPWGDAFSPGSADVLLHRHDADAGLPLAPAGSSPRDRSIYGVLDLGGSLAEWVEGGFPGDARFGVLRGGSWARGPEVVRLASREPVDPSSMIDAMRLRDRTGLRVAFDATW